MRMRLAAIRSVGYQVLAAAHEDLLHTLLGLNRVYYSGFKSLEPVVAELANRTGRSPRANSCLIPARGGY